MIEIREETAKERIKRKKKERADAEKLSKKQLDESPVVNEETTPIDVCIGEGETEVLEVYPSTQETKKLLAHGTVKIKMPHVGIELRNITYRINKRHEVAVQPPFRYYRFPEEPEKRDAYIESIKFLNRKTWKEATKKIKKVVLEYHQDDLPEPEQPKDQEQ